MSQFIIVVVLFLNGDPSALGVTAYAPNGKVAVYLSQEDCEEVLESQRHILEGVMQAMYQGKAQATPECHEVIPVGLSL